MHSFIAAWARCAPATRLSLVAVLLGLVNSWLGIAVGLAAAWAYASKLPEILSRHRVLAFFLPMGVALAYIGQGESLPADDLMRHLSAWQLGLDYRAQYPWSDIPQANLWLGFDYALGVLQRAGLSKDFLLQWLPGLSLLLQTVVLFFALERKVPKHRHNAEVFLLAGSLGLLLLTPRSLLGRPEMFLLIFGACAWLCRSRVSAAAWSVGFLALVPMYWLGWVYAPMALLLAPARLSLVARLVLAAVLGIAHLVFWQTYTGDYLGLMVWLRGTLSILASENAPLLRGFDSWAAWVLVGALSLGLSLLNRRRAWAAAPVLALLIWFAAPNQVRYLAAIAFVALPWLYRLFVVRARASRAHIPAVVALLGLAMAAGLTVRGTEAPAKFPLGADARVYSESPYATVFYGQPGIAVEPSFAMGATRPEWAGLSKEGALSCDLLKQGRFTHVIEKSLGQPLACAELSAVQGPWRLWTIKKD